MGRAAHRERPTPRLRAAVGVVPAAIAVIAVGLASLLTQDGAAAATETWTPTSAESAAPPVAARFGAPNDVHALDALRYVEGNQELDVYISFAPDVALPTGKKYFFSFELVGPRVLA